MRFEIGDVIECRYPSVRYMEGKVRVADIAQGEYVFCMLGLGVSEGRHRFSYNIENTDKEYVYAEETLRKKMMEIINA